MRYLHIMTVQSPIYNDMVIKMVNEEEEFKSCEHQFIITKQKGHNTSNHYSNVKVDENFLSSRLKSLNSVSVDYDYIFVHGLSFTHKQFIFLSRSTAKKIIWCVWGSDLYNRKIKITKDFSWYRRIRRATGNLAFDIIECHKVKMFAAIAIGFMYDKFEINRLYGQDMKIVNAPYGLGYQFEKVKNALNEYRIKDSDKPIKIMIGHSAYPFLNHVKILRKLEKFKNENLIISIPLNYGNESYTKEIEGIAREIYGHKVEILKEYMKPDEYLKYLMSVDIAIFDYKHQAALANIYLLLYMGKKLFFNESGILYKAMVNERISAFNFNKIDEMQYANFTERNFDYIAGKNFAQSILDETIIKNKWLDLFYKLENHSI